MCPQSLAAEGCYWGRGWAQIIAVGQRTAERWGAPAPAPHQTLGAPSAAGPNGFAASLALQLP